MRVWGGPRLGRLRWPVGVVAALALLLAALWGLGWQGGAPHTDGPASTPAPGTATSTAWEPGASAGRVDLMGVVVAVEAGATWDDPPTGDCPDPGRGPLPEDCPRLGPATLVLEGGARVQVPAGTPGDPVLWDLAHPAGGPAPAAFALVGLRDDWTAAWVYVPDPGEVPESPSLPGGPVSSLAADGWAVTEGGWSYRLEGLLLTTGCAHLLPWTLAGPAPGTESAWLPRARLATLWDGPAGTRLDLGPGGHAAVRAVGALTCTDLLPWRGDPDPAGTLAAARALWSSGRDYRFRYTGGGAWGDLGTWEVTVLAGEVSAAMLTPPTGLYQYPPHSPFQPPTVDDLFDRIEEVLHAPDSPDGCLGTQYWAARYDPGLGSPTSFNYDSPACADEEYSWQVEWLQLLYEGFPLCAGWGPDPVTGVTLPDSPYGVWDESRSLQVGQTWRHEITIDGCGFPFLYLGGTRWKQVSRTYAPGTKGDHPGLGTAFASHSYPADWPVCYLGVHGGPLIQVYGLITLAAAHTLEATTLDGDPIALYEPTDEEPPYCTE